MTRVVRYYLVGSCFVVLAMLAGCAGGFVEQREPWRREAEAQCLKSGGVHESASIVMQKPINGPGMCGADFPLLVSALGDGAALGYADDILRPPGAIPRRHPLDGARSPAAPANASFPSQTPPVWSDPPARGDAPTRPAPWRGDPPAWREAPRVFDNAAPAAGVNAQSGPVSLAPPGLATPAPDPSGAYVGGGALPPRRQDVDAPAANGPGTVPFRAASPAPVPPLGPPLGPPRPPPVAARLAATVTPAATLACPLVSTLDRWLIEAVQPAAQKWFGQPVAGIKQISAYSCRGMNGNPRARISEHAFGNALDIASFTLADGRIVTVKDGWRGRPQEQGFLRDIQAAACERFATVLAPGSNVYHYDHIHLDLMRRSGTRQICNPQAVAGEVIAARARLRLAGRGGEPVTTGSLRDRRPPPPSLRHDGNAFPDDIDDDRHHPLPVRR
ncbi:MAG: extensin family protein [Proteobacteria bacterium]|nr:extensin family protein [Pseudomonadota bacterium]